MARIGILNSCEPVDRHARAGVATPHLVLLSPREADAEEARRAASAHCEIVAASGARSRYLLRPPARRCVIMSLDQAGLVPLRSALSASRRYGRTSDCVWRRRGT